jgi:regulator of protease activity HflC (stomatin/prohibitin superfamily)
MNYLKYLALGVIGVILLTIITLTMFVQYIPVGQVGVLTKVYGILGDKGVVKHDFGSGYHLNIPPLHSWIKFDKTVQTLEMTRDPMHGSERGRDDVQVQSADGYKVSVDVTIKYRIADNKAHKVYQNSGSGNKYKRIVRNESEEACINSFGKMRTESFYNPKKRSQAAREIKNALSDSLSDNYAEVIDVLIRNVQFDPDYEKRIQRKKLADQEVELNRSLKKAREKQGLREVTEAETQRELEVINREQEAEITKKRAQTERQIAEIRANAKRKAREKRADADLIAAQNRAKGTLRIKEAEAAGEALRNEAMAGSGGDVIVALEAARNLQLGNITVSTQSIDFLDLDHMIRRLGFSVAPESTE